jgi:hypothetical protein
VEGSCADYVVVAGPFECHVWGFDGVPVDDVEGCVGSVVGVGDEAFEALPGEVDLEFAGLWDESHCLDNLE